MMTRIFTFFTVFLMLQAAFSQTRENLKKSKQLYIHGNSILVGNNVLGHHTTRPMMQDEVPNDAVNMKYIDVDDDKATFSSSQATIKAMPNDSRVAYAALYWTGLYPYEKGILRTSGGRVRYIARGEREGNVNQVLFKTPGNEYTPIEGTVLKDEIGKEGYADIAPYACRADVTEILQELSDIAGVYTVGNIRAAEGKIPGGGSAGWLLYIVYENTEESLKYFTTYDGLIEVDREKVDIKFSGFRSKQEGKINPTLGIGALEGDRKIRSDQMLLYNEKEDDFVPMSNALREERNFFNSSITMGNSVYQDRNPNSSNTLGFDLLKLNIPNEKNQFFDENTTEATLRFQTRADRFYLFFVSFEIDLDQDYLELVNFGWNQTESISKKDGLQKTEKMPTTTQIIKSSDSNAIVTSSIQRPETEEAAEQGSVQEIANEFDGEKSNLSNSESKDDSLAEGQQANNDRVKVVHTSDKSELLKVESANKVKTIDDNTQEIDEENEVVDVYSKQQYTQESKSDNGEDQVGIASVEKEKEESSKTKEFEAPDNGRDSQTSSDKKDVKSFKNAEIFTVNGIRKARYPNLSESEAAEIKHLILTQENRIIPGLPTGYYLVTNVFDDSKNAIRWREFLISKGFTPHTFVNPENDWEYIYIQSFDDLENGFELWKQHQDKEYFIGLWLMKVNMGSTAFIRSN